MEHEAWLLLMRFPSEWKSWGLIPDELAALQLNQYALGDESHQHPEHNRHGAFQWWLKKEPDSGILLKLVHLSWLDPDEPMAEYVRSRIAKQPHCNAEVLAAIDQPYRRA